jgi:3-hydroxyisobutyrate dehydrogenase-like beta-hydroxyacid dehydrogenase
VGRRIGFLGIGLMGRGMARSLARAGHSVTAYNRTRGKAEEVAGSGVPGIEAADTPADAVRGAEVVVTMLADPRAVREVCEGPDGMLAALESGAVVIDSSTVDPGTTHWVAERLRGRGGSLLDAPVFGSRNEAERGELGFIVGGDREVFESVRDVFEVMGSTIHYLGPSGMGSSAKLVVNLIIATTLQAFNEGMVLAAKVGLDLDTLFEVVQTSRARSGIIEMKGPPVLQRDFTPFFPLKLMDKDVRLALETAESLHIPMPLLGALKGVYTACVASGLGEEDFAAAVKLLERYAGVEVASAANKSTAS